MSPALRHLALIQITIISILPISQPSNAQTFTNERQFLAQPSCDANSPSCTSPFLPMYYTYPDPTERSPLSNTKVLKVQNIQEVNSDDYYVRYTTWDDPRCRYRSCAMTVPRSRIKTKSMMGDAVEVLTFGIVNAEVDANCSVCGGPQEQARRRAEAARRSGPFIRINLDEVRMRSEAKRPPYSLTAAEVFLKADRDRKLQCSGRRYLHESLGKLRDAQNVFNIPAASIACLIGKESKWDPSARGKKEDGSFSGYDGLVQTNAASITTMRGRLDPKSASFDPVLKRLWDVFTGRMPFTEVNLPNMYRANSDSMTRAQRDRMAIISIAYVALSLRQQMNLRLETAARFGSRTSQALNGTPSQLAMAYIAYNAGNGNANQIIPDEAYRGPNYDNLAWAQKLKPNAGSGTIEQAENYVREIHRCEASSSISAAPGSQPKTPPDECGL